MIAIAAHGCAFASPCSRRSPYRIIPQFSPPNTLRLPRKPPPHLSTRSASNLWGCLACCGTQHALDELANQQHVAHFEWKEIHTRRIAAHSATCCKSCLERAAGRSTRDLQVEIAGRSTLGFREPRTAYRQAAYHFVLSHGDHEVY